jgi:hypothetical protein
MGKTIRIVLVALAVGFACGHHEVGPNSSVVGGRCAQDSDCAHRCATGDKFPGGFCTMSCLGDADCPHGALCVDRNNGICLVACNASQDCTAFGPTYKCDDHDRKGAPGKALVCIGG